MAEPWSPEDKAQELEGVRQEWSNCTSCLLSETRNNVVFGSGNPNADILLIGEAPGEEEDKSGNPFIGESGILLEALFEMVGIDRDHEFLTNLVACRPPKNRDPSSLEIKTCWHRLINIIYIIDPILVVPIGAEALKAFASGRELSILKKHGEVFSSCHPTKRIPGDQMGLDTPGMLFPRKDKEKKEYTLDYDMIPIVHPSYILREDHIEKGKPLNIGVPSSWCAKTLEDLKKIRHYVDVLKARHEDPRCAI